MVIYAVSELVVASDGPVSISLLAKLDSSVSGFAGISSTTVIKTVSLSVELVFAVVISEVVVVSILVCSEAS